MSHRAFTLIELLVVVAIVAALAGILFPVFAQARLAAKKTQDLSNLKQVNLGTMMYAGDHDDRFPIQTPRNDDGSWCWGCWFDVPWDLRSGQNDHYYDMNRATWANATHPYVKSLDVLSSPVRATVWPAEFGDQRAQWTEKPASASYALNGLLEQYATSAVASPSRLVSFSAPLGGVAIEGGSFAQPYLVCNDPDAACVYVPMKPDCGAERNGEWSGTWSWPEQGFHLRPSFGSGSNFAYADGSAGFRRMFANMGGKTDYRTDPYSRYDAAGNAEYSWYDEHYCHSLLFQPDFDFQSWGNPVEGS